jgi:hypothetical protein
MITAPSTALDTALSDDTQVTTMGPITSGTSHIPQGANGTVIAEVGNGATLEVLFGPPVSATEDVSESLLAVA